MRREADVLPSPIGGGAGGEGEAGAAHLLDAGLRRHDDAHATVAQALQAAVARLERALGLEPRDARLEARILAARALGVDRTWLVAHDRDALLPAQVDAVETLISRREAGEPVAYILGEREFYGRLFKVTPDVLIPRPETELLVQLALERMPTDQPCDVLDLGTGSGVIALTIAMHRPLAKILAVDVSSAALDLARTNAEGLGTGNVGFLRSDWYSGLTAKNFDIIVSNPPYIAPDDAHLSTGDLRFEPLLALHSPACGLADIDRIVTGAKAHLRPEGWLLFEHGHDQGKVSSQMLRRLGWCGVQTWKDMAGLDRVSGGRTT